MHALKIDDNGDFICVVRGTDLKLEEKNIEEPIKISTYYKHETINTDARNRNPNWSEYYGCYFPDMVWNEYYGCYLPDY